MIWQGFRDDLTRDDLWQVGQSERSEGLVRKLEHEWKKKSSEFEVILK